MLMSIELILNSVNLNFVAFNKYLWPGKMEGLFFTLFIIAIAAAEAAVAIAIIINLYRSHKSIDVEKAEELKYWLMILIMNQKLKTKKEIYKNI